MSVQNYNNFCSNANVKRVCWDWTVNAHTADMVENNNKVKDL